MLTDKYILNLYANRANGKALTWPSQFAVGGRVGGPSSQHQAAKLNESNCSAAPTKIQSCLHQFRTRATHGHTDQ